MRNGAILKGENHCKQIPEFGSKNPAIQPLVEMWSQLNSCLATAHETGLLGYYSRCEILSKEVAILLSCWPDHICKMT